MVTKMTTPPNETADASLSAIGLLLAHRWPWGVLEGDTAMSLIPCSFDGQRIIGKPATCYWAWNLADGSRRAYRQRICEDCFRDRLVALIASAESPALICPSCHSPTVDDFDAVYLTYFLPGMPKGRSDMPLCPKCAVHVRQLAMENADSLADRESSLGASAPNTSTARDWEAMGLRFNS